MTNHRYVKKIVFTIFNLLYIFFILFFTSKIFAQFNPSSKTILILKGKPGIAYSQIPDKSDSIFQLLNKIGDSNPQIFERNSSQSNTSFIVTGAFTLTIDTTGGSCGYGNGSIIITASGGTPPYVYTYNYLGIFTYTQNTGNFQQVPGGPYIITVTDANGQIVTTNLNLSNTYPAPHVEIASYIAPSSCTAFDGSITFIASSGTPPYRYSIDGVNYQTSSTFNGLSQGSYSMFVSDANGCIYGYLGEFFFIDDDPVCYNKLAIRTYSTYSCNNDGIIILGTPFSGTPPFQYSLDGINYRDSGYFNNLGGGYHNIYFKDATGLTNIFTVYIIASCIVSISFIEVDAACMQNDGSLTATVINGTPPYTYTIDGINYQTSNTFTGLSPGNYTITVKDLNGITVSQQATVFNKCPTVSATETDETCNQKNGTITATGNKGTAPYQFSIDGLNFQSGNIFSGLTAGNYAVTIKDAGGFKSTTSVTVNSNCLLLVLNINNTACSNKNGSIRITGSNGTAPYQYSIDDINFQTNNLFDTLTAGNYTITVKDANGLTKDSTVTINDEPAAKISVAVTNASCSNTNGSINITTAGGTALLQYSIDNGVTFQSNNIFNNLDSALYIIVVQDSNICTTRDTVQLAAPPKPKVFLGMDTTICNGQTLLLATPLVANYKYLWQDNSTNNGLLVTSPGNYSVQVTNQFNCSISDTVTIAYRPLPVFSLGNDTSFCDGRLLLLQSITAVQGSYAWNTGSTASSININKGGLYWLQVTDGGCARRDSINIIYKPNPLIHLGNDTALCAGNALTLNATNNNATYLWQDGSTQPTFAVTKPGIYSVTVRLNGCDTSGSINVTYLSKPVVNLGTDTTLCITENLLLDVSYPQSTYLWQDGSELAHYNVTQPGTYSVDVTNTCGTTNASINITYENCACKFYVPTAFSPNGDGKNDVFKPGYECFFSNYEMKIFNRWGQLVFATQNAGIGWDGNYKNMPQPVGVYVYELTYKDNITGKSIRNKGQVMLIR